MSWWIRGRNERENEEKKEKIVKKDKSYIVMWFDYVKNKCMGMVGLEKKK